MTFRCRDLQDALRDGNQDSIAAATIHAEGCESCREMLESWNALTEAAPSLRKSWDSPDLWPQIQRALAEESQKRRSREHAGTWILSRLIPLTAAVAAIAFAGWLTIRGREPRDADRGGTEQRLLTERALAQVERSEAAYIAAIDQMAKVAEPVLDQTPSPLIASYREKLALLDDAIADCREQIERNRFNAHLRGELIAIYRDKQRTLEALIGEKS